jgi:hypothetical protein
MKEGSKLQGMKEDERNKQVSRNEKVRDNKDSGKKRE